MLMPARRSLGLLALAVALSIAVYPARAGDDLKYPDLKGEWMRLGSGSFDPGKPAGLGQKAPLTTEYQAVLEASLAEQAAGGQGNNPMGECIPPGMPRTMIDYEGMELVVTPQTTYIMLLEPHEPAAPDLHRRAGVAAADHALLPRLFDRHLGGRGPRWPLRRAPGRDPRDQGAAQL